MSTTWDLPHDLAPEAMSRQPKCGACDHEVHSPARCDDHGCQCSVVPVPGIYP